MSRLTGWMPTSVRARLLLSFGVLFVSAALLALVGWLGIRGTAASLESFRTGVLPEVAVSLELSQRTAAIAAIAPYVADSTLPFQLQSEALAMQARMTEAERLAASLPPASSLSKELVPVLADVRKNVEELIDVTRKDLFLQEDLRELMFQLEGLKSSLLGQSPGTDLSRLLDDIESAAVAPDAAALDRLEPGAIERTERMLRRHRDMEALGTFVRGNVLGPNSIFMQRRQHFGLAERKAFLVVQARAQADRLSDRVERYVRQLRLYVDAEGQAMDRALHSGVVGIAMIGLACAAVAVLAIRFVNRTVNSLGGITFVMSRLASGDLHQSTPEVSRQDELGALARAFEVFRENAREMRRLSDNLQEQSGLLATVFDSIHDGLSVFDARCCLIAWNRPFAAILGVPSVALERGMRLEAVQALIPSRTMDGTLPGGGLIPLRELNNQRQREGHRFELTLTDGRVVEFLSNPMPGGGFVTLYRDLTERRRVEQQLRQAQKMEVLGQFTSGVAHDFNNLLAAVLGNLHLIEEGEPLSARNLRFVARVRKAVERGAALASRLLAFARRQTLTPQAVNVDELIEDLADLIEYSLGKSIGLELNLDTRGHRIWVDKGQLENALLNLVINARDAMSGSGRLRLQTRCVDDSQHLYIDVADTGHGMDAAVRERVFEPFFTTKSELGSGLGLSMVYGFVKQSGGDISLSSEVGQGTVFTLMLPLADAPTAAAESAAPLPPDAPIEPQSVLLVEDDADVRVATADLLLALGHTVRTAASAHEALSLLDDAITLVLSDVDLGGSMNGPQLLREIAERHPGVPCILMSGLPYEVLSTRFHLAEPALLLGKPFSLAQLEACLRKGILRPRA
jgi:signal transduction histidine kinase/HAMP domain-containing protein